MMNDILKQGICLLLFAGLFTGTFVVTADQSAQLQCITRPDATVPAGSDVYYDCIDKCQASCEPGHWYSGLCRGVCIMGCSGIPPDFPGISELKFHGMFS